MKILATIIFAVMVFISPSALSCDEQCLRDKAQAKHNVKFPKYLTWEYCDSITMEFMTGAVRSLDNYRTNHLSTRFKGPLRNTKSFIEQRKIWLEECDEYLTVTKELRVFEDEKTTKAIFASMDSVTSELGALINGASYSSMEDENLVINEKFDDLFKRIDDHKTLMHLKGRYVFR